MSENNQSSNSINTIYCKKCDKDFPVESIDSFVSLESKDEMSWKCSGCKKEYKDKLELGCPSCLKNFWILSGLLGNDIECPHCKTRLVLPTRNNWEDENKQLEEGFKLTVSPSSGGPELHYIGRDKITDAITNNKVKGIDICYSFKFSPIRTLKEVCDEHFSLRKLYDPVGAYSSQVGVIIGFIFLAIYLIGWLIGGIIKLGSPFLLYALFGILAVVLTPTVIGLFIVYLIASSVGVPLLGAYLGVLFVVISAAAAFGIGYGLGYGIMRLISKIIKLENKRVVDWS